MVHDFFIRKRRNSLIFFGAVIIVTIGTMTLVGYDPAKGLTSIFQALIWGVSNFYPDAKALQKLPDLLLKLRDTVLTSIAATTTASVFALFMSLAGSKTTRINSIFGVISRGIASVFRNVPLVAWAMVLMIAFSQSQLTGYLALFCGSFGFLTRAFMETIDEVGKDSVEALKAAGATYFHIIFQAVLPSSMPQMISWLLYMIETNIRDATLVGILTGTGIGFAFDLYYNSLRYNIASLIVILIIVTVMAIEFISNIIRRVIL
ncbi:MAG: ABC transporter permease subunit [Bacillota bacterium]|nr:ABC transporter permease subunit [Bacillota bacterium]